MTRFHVGVDIGQSQDYTAIVVLESLHPPEIPVEQGRLLVVRYLTRFRDVLYPDVADTVENLVKHRRLARGGVSLAVDATGVGPAVTDLLTKRGMHFKSVKIHGGDAETHGEGGVYRVPKRDLISALQVLLQTEVLKIPRSLNLAETLRAELLNFRVKINVNSGHDSYEAWREEEHDDLVLAAALAAWSAGKEWGGGVPVGVGAKSSHWGLRSSS